jgi:hypothetical protein
MWGLLLLLLPLCLPADVRYALLLLLLVLLLLLLVLLLLLLLLLQADVYSFGVIMWELWTMQEPFAGVHIHALLHQLTTQGRLSLAVPGSAEWVATSASATSAPATSASPATSACATSAPAEPAPGWSDLMQRCWQADAGSRPSSRQLVGELEEMMTAVRRAKK